MLRRTSVLRQSQRVARFYSGKASDSPAGLSGHSDSASGFDQRERSNEDWYIKQQEQAHLKQLRDEIQKREKELGELKDKANKLEN